MVPDDTLCAIAELTHRIDMRATMMKTDTRRLEAGIVVMTSSSEWLPRGAGEAFRLQHQIHVGLRLAQTFIADPARRGLETARKADGICCIGRRPHSLCDRDQIGRAHV